MIQRVELPRILQRARADPRPGRQLGPVPDGPQRGPLCRFTPEVNDQGSHVVLRLRIQIKRHDGRRVLLGPDGGDLLARIASDGRLVPREHLLRAVGSAFAWRRELLRSDCSITSIAQEAGVARARVQALLTLTQLSPLILRAILTGELGLSISLEDLIGAAQHLDWSRQARLLSL